MLLVATEKLVAVLPGSVVVINPVLKTYTAQLEQLGLQVVINEHAEQGMGSSIACGVGASKDVRAWLITLVDMPYIKTEILTLLADKLTKGACMVAPQYKHQRGHPVGFSHVYLSELLDLNEGVVRDIDYPDDV